MDATRQEVTAPGNKMSTMCMGCSFLLQQLSHAGYRVYFFL